MEKNELYPIFLKPHELNLLVVGGGNVALEKLGFLFKSSPRARVTLVAPMIRDACRELAGQHQVHLLEQRYHPGVLEGKHLVIAATDDPQVNLQVFRDCRQRQLLVNVADHPQLCDFYMGGIVTKGHLKLAISTNGKSPTAAKRLRQFFEQVLPDSLDELLENLHSYRETLKGDFEEKVQHLNEFTKRLIS